MFWLGFEASRGSRQLRGDVCKLTLADCQRSPNRTFLRGTNEAAIGVFRASTRGARSLKCLIRVCAKFFSSAVSAGRVVLRPHCLHLIKSIAGWSQGKPL